MYLPQGDIDWKSALANLEKIGPAIKAGQKVIQDPALNEVSCNILRLNRINAGEPPGPPCKKKVYTQADYGKGIGLTSAIKPLRGFMWALERPVITGMGVMMVVGLIFATGYALGRAK